MTGGTSGPAKAGTTGSTERMLSLGRAQATLNANVIDERITRLVSLFMSALKRANIRAFPVESSDIARSKLVSGFLKWMVSSGYIPRFFREMELGANYLLERGILISYVGWHREDRELQAGD